MTESTMIFSKYVTAKEICELLHISKSSLHKMSKSGAFPAPIQIGKCKRWESANVKAWLDNQQANNTTS